MRCSTLDKKSQVSDHEINTLAEEKIRLLQQVESLEAQVEELIVARDEAQRQAAGNSAQWQQIMQMSSQLQIKGMDESKRHKSEREAWERDRAGLQQRVQELETGQPSTVSSGASSSPTSLGPDAILSSANLEILREEIVRLRRSCVEMEAALRDIREGGDQKLYEALQAISSIREQIKGTGKGKDKGKGKTPPPYEMR